MNIRISKLGACATGLAMTIVSGCASLPNSLATSRSAVPPGTGKSASVDQATLDRAQRAESEIARSSTAVPAQDAAPRSASTPEPNAALLPPNAKPGECYARVLIPGRYETSTEQVVTQSASERIEIIPARYELSQERVQVRDTSTRLEVVPAVYEDLSEQVMIKPATKQIKETPAQYEREEKTVLVKAGYTTWKRGPATAQTGNVRDERTGDTGEIMCLVDVPPVYESVVTKKLVAPASTQEIEMPAEYRTIRRRVVKTPATTREVLIPAEFTTVNVKKLASDATEKRIGVPEESKTLTTRKLVSEAKVEWRQILCVTNQTPARVMAIQKALHAAGQEPGPIDGVMGTSTLAASNTYAAANGLETGNNYITLQVVRALKVSL